MSRMWELRLLCHRECRHDYNQRRGDMVLDVAKVLSALALI